MNAALYITPKSSVTYLYDDWNVKYALGQLKKHGFTAVPVMIPTFMARVMVTIYSLITQVLILSSSRDSMLMMYMLYIPAPEMTLYSMSRIPKKPLLSRTSDIQLFTETLNSYSMTRLLA